MVVVIVVIQVRRQCDIINPTSFVAADLLTRNTDLRRVLVVRRLHALVADGVWEDGQVTDGELQV